MGQLNAAGVAGIDLSVIDLHEVGGIEPAVKAFASVPKEGSS
jgi:hypothetical protein